MTQTDRAPTRAIQKAVKGRAGEVLDNARPVRTRRTKAQMAQPFEAAEVSERNLLRSITTNSGAGR